MKKFYRRSISGLLALLICFTAILSSGVTAFAASSSGKPPSPTLWRFQEMEMPIWTPAAHGDTTSSTI